MDDVKKSELKQLISDLYIEACSVCHCGGSGDIFGGFNFAGTMALQRMIETKEKIDKLLNE